MVSTTFLALNIVAVMGVNAADSQFGIKATVPAASQPASANTVSGNVLTLKKSTMGSKSSGFLGGIRNGATSEGTYKYGSTPVNDLEGVEYIAEVEWAGKPFEVIVDTGSSDTWLVQSGFTCVDVNGAVQVESACNFGPSFNGTFGGGEIPDENFNITYGDGEFLKGVLGYEDVTVAGITVKHQEVALVNFSYWNGDGVTSGLMGLAYPLLTSAYKGTNSTTDSPDTQVEYDPIFTTMYKERLVPPVFSLAQERNSNSGYLAFGGLPPVSFSPVFASTPLLMVEIYDLPKMATQYSFYTIIADSYIYEGSGKTAPNTGKWGSMFPEFVKNDTQFPIIVDSGTTLLYLPTELAKSILNLYDPPAIYIEEQGSYFAPCNATVPKLGVEIGSTVFWISEADMLMQNSTYGNYCTTGPQDGGSNGPYILGDTFLNNVVAIFDVGASEMRFAAHTY